MLSKGDKDYLAKRRKLTGLWPGVACFMLLLLIALSVGLFLKTPYLINPWHVFEAFEANQVDIGIMEISTLILPIVTLMLLVVVGSVIAMGFALISNDKRYLDIIDKLNNET